MTEMAFQIKLNSQTRNRDSNTGRFLAGVHAGASNAALAIANYGMRISADLAPKRTGRMAASGKTRRSGVYRAETIFDAPYLMAQEEGAVAHLIGTEGQTLYNEEEGFGPTRGPVLHPGNPATHFMRAGYEAAAAAGTEICRALMS